MDGEELSIGINHLWMEDYIMDVSEDVTGLELKFSNDVEIGCSEDTEDAVAKQNSNRVEDEVVDIHDAEGAVDYERDD